MDMSEDRLKEAGYRDLEFPYSQVLNLMLSSFL